MPNKARFGVLAYWRNGVMIFFSGGTLYIECWKLKTKIIWIAAKPLNDKCILADCLKNTGSNSQMIIDAHTHIFPEEIRKNREAYFSDEPAFKKLYQSPKSKLIGAREMLAAMDENRVSRAVIFGFPWKSSKTSLSVRQSNTCWSTNRSLGLRSRWRLRLSIPFVTISPWTFRGCSSIRNYSGARLGSIQHWRIAAAARPRPAASVSNPCRSRYNRADTGHTVR